MSGRTLNVRFCADCGRMILVGFDFCPYCGSAIPPEPEDTPPRPGRAEGPGLGDPVAAGPAIPESGAGRPGIPRDEPEARALLDRLIRELEALDAEMEEWTVHGGR